MGVLSAICVAVAALVGYAIRGGKPATTPAVTPPAPPTSTPAPTADPVQGKFLSTLVTLKNKGLTHLAEIFDAVWTNNKPALEKLAVVEAEHLLQGGPSLVLQDLESFFMQTLLAKLNDPAELQNLLNTVRSNLGANNPALNTFAQSIVAAQSPAPSTPA